MIEKFSGDFVQWLRGFYYTARLGSVSGAARHLGLIQSAVSHHIRQLEKELDVQLFRRGPKEMELTDEGRILQEKAIRLFEMLREIRQEVGRRETELSGYIRIVTTFGVSVRLLPDLINEFVALHPKVRFAVHGGGFGMINEQVTGGSADFGILTLQPFADSIIVTPLFETSLVLVSPEGNPFGLSRPTTFEEVSKTPFISFPPRNTFENVLQGILENQGRALTIAAETNSVEPMLKFVENGLGVTVLDKFALADNDRKLEFFNITPALPPRRYVMITRQGKYLAPQVRAFQNMLMERLSALPDASGE